MPVFEHKGYKLHTLNVELKGGRNQTIFFFSKGKPKSGKPTDMPKGYKVGVNKKTGLPYLSKT